MMRFSFLFLLFLPSALVAQRIQLDKLLATHTDSLGVLVRDAKTYRTQLIYTEVVHRRSGKVKLKTHRWPPTLKEYATKSDRYIYPASTVKLPVAALSLEFLEANFPLAGPQTVLHFDSISEKLPAVKLPEHNAGEALTVEGFLRLLFTVSDNDAYNRLLELVGYEYVNQRMREMGYTETMIWHRVGVGALTDLEHTTMPRVVLLNGRDTIGVIPQRSMALPYFGAPILIGNAYYQGDSLLQKPLDFSHKNHFSIDDQHAFMERLVFPKLFKKRQRLRISEQNRQFLLRHMSMFPREAGTQAAYQHPDGYCKFLVGGGDATTLPDGVTIYNKVGEAYGFLTDLAYITDAKTGRSFFISASVYVNPDGILNDDAYGYDDLGIPFLRRLGWLLLDR